jgi:hypothetical protein
MSRSLSPMLFVSLVGGAAFFGTIFSNSNPSLAGTIVSSPAPAVSGPGLGFANVAAVVTVQANNDNVPSPNALDNNIVVPLKRFDSANYIDIVFTVAPSDGVTEYQVSEFVDNNTALPWTNYRMQLGFGTGAGFVLSAANDGLDFDAPNYDTPPVSAAFSTVQTPNEDELVFTNGLHGMGAQPYSFRVDVPNLIGRINSTFTLRQLPTPVPEPSVLSLIGMGLFMLARTRRRG